MGWSEQDIYDVLSDLDRIEDARSPDELLKTLSACFSRWGFNHVVLLQMINPARAKRPLREYGITNYPQEFVEKWFTLERAMHDPILRMGSATRTSFHWNDARDYANKIGQRMMNEGQDVGLKNGLGIPIAVPFMPLGLVGLPHSNPDFSKTDLVQIELLSVHAYTHFLKLTETLPVKEINKLTGRETEVMHYVAAGKSYEDIAVILSISRDTVGFHMKNISRKLNALNRAQCVAIAIRDGQILP